MDIRDFLRKLDNVSGPNKSGEYTARCPCHDDKTASLTVVCKASARDGRRRIYFYDHARCPHGAILSKLGLTDADLIVDPDPARNGKKGGKARKSSAPPPPEPPPAQAPERKEAPKIDFAHPAAVYSYTDEGGKELFQVCRYEYQRDGKREKTFRQRRYAPGDPTANGAGYINSVPNELRDSVLYRMPEVAAAIRDGMPVYVVEGEKDVETLRRLGHTATCNAGGAGKWRDSYSRLLAGADVIILPDNDTAENGYTGQNHALDVALRTRLHAKRVRLVDIKAACPDLPDKGDISDMVQLLGDRAAMDALARQVAATRDFDPGTAPFWLTPMEQVAELYSKVPGYCVANGCICQITQDATKALTDFVVIPRMELTRDDGVNTSMWFALDGWDCCGHKLQRAVISAKELDAMSWVTGKWGFSANLAPGTATKDKVAWAIKKVGQMTAKRVTEYNHTGWRKIDGKWCYLYHGGAVGLDGVTVDMGDTLNAYRLDGSGADGFDDMPWLEACERSLGLQYVMKPEIGIALLGTIYLAPLREFMGQTDLAPAYALFLNGRTQTRKTTAAALALSHFGNFHSKRLPASFNDTSNSIRQRAFLLKDMPLLVDDYHPVRSPQEKNRMATIAQTLSRAFGDGSDRGRMNADRTVQASMPPRCVAIITGEYLPEIGESGQARFFVVDVKEGDIPMGPELTDMQEAARHGWLQRAMLGYIKWLSKQVDELPELLHNSFLSFRQMCIETHGLKGRAPETVACIMIGYQMMLNYFRDVGLFDTETARQMLLDAHRTLTSTSKQQAKDMENEKPTKIFLTSMQEMLANKTVVLRDLTDPNSKPGGSPAMTMCGYMDNDYYYLLPKTAFGCVSRMCREQGVDFPVSLKSLYKYMREDGILSSMGNEGEYTRNKFIDGRAQRLLWIPRDALDGPATDMEQMKMQMSQLVEIDDPELPFDQ